MHERLKQIREKINLSQAAFAKELGMGQSTLGMMEVGKRDILDRHIKTICSVFNVNEEWFRTGMGEMFIKSETFSLDEYAKNCNLTDLELDIMRGYMELDESTRKTILHHFKSIFKQHLDTETADEINIDTEVESYRKELEDEKREKTFSALQPPEESTM